MSNLKEREFKVEQQEKKNLIVNELLSLAVKIQSNECSLDDVVEKLISLRQDADLSGMVNISENIHYLISDIEDGKFS